MGENAEVWRLVKAELAGSGPGSVLAQALSAADAARGDALAAQNAARDAITRAAEDAVRQVGAAAGGALKQLDAASVAARQQVAAAADSALQVALERGEPAAEAAGQQAPQASAPAAAAGDVPPPPRASEFGDFFRNLASLKSPLTGNSLSTFPAAFSAALGGGNSSPAPAPAPAPTPAALAPQQASQAPVGVPHMATGGITWKVDGLPTVEKLRASPPGKSLESQPFAVGSLHFTLVLWPGGDGSPGSEGHVSLGLRLGTPGACSRVEYDLSVVNQATGIALTRITNPWGTLTELTCSLDEPVAPGTHGRADADAVPMSNGVTAASHAPPSPDMARWPQFLSHARVANFREELMRAGALVVCARVSLASSGPADGNRHHSTHHHGHGHGHHSHPVPVPPRRLAADWGAMLSSGDGADVRFIVRPLATATSAASRTGLPVTFLAHRLVLCSRCAGMRTLLGGVAAAVGGGGGYAQQQAFEISDCDADAFGSLLHFLYTDDMETRQDEHAISALLALASRFDVPRLVGLCAHRIADMLAPANALRLALLGETHKCPPLRRAATECMKAHVDEVTSAAEWDHAIASHPRFMADLTRQLLPQRGGAAAVARDRSSATPASGEAPVAASAVLAPRRGVVLRRDAYDAGGQDNM